MPDAHRLQDYSEEYKATPKERVVKRALLQAIHKPHPKGSPRQAQLAYHKAKARAQAMVDNLNEAYATKGIRYVFFEDDTHFRVYTEQVVEGGE